MKSRVGILQRSFAVGLALIVAGSGVALNAQPPAGPLAQPQPAAQVLSPQQLDDLVAPIALYPDPLLGQVLAASTYPLEVVEAEQWIQRNSGLSGPALIDAAKQQNWDPSVQALAAFPDVLAKMNQDVRWTTDLGNAFLAQQADVMYAVQRMRASAQSRGKLSSSPQATVTTRSDNGQSAIEIQPASPQVIYVPNYDPMYVWGPPVYGYYPPLVYPSFGFGFWPGINVGLYFGGWGGWGGWGWGPNWFGGGLFINAGFFHSYGFRGSYGFNGVGAWAHDPGHRLGVSYANARVAQRYGAASRAGAASMGSRYSAGQSYGANRGANVNRAQPGGYGNRSSAQSYQSFRNSAPQNSARSYSNSSAGAASRNSSNSYRSSPYSSRSSAQSAPRSFSSPSGRSFGGGGFGGGHSFGGGGHSGGGGHRR